MVRGSTRLVAVMLVWLAACGPSSGGGSDAGPDNDTGAPVTECSAGAAPVRASCTSGMPQGCVEYSGAWDDQQVMAVQSACEGGGGSFTPGACPRANMIGACQLGSNGACTTGWGQPSSGDVAMQRAELMDACAREGGYYIAPQ